MRDRRRHERAFGVVESIVLALALIITGCAGPAPSRPLVRFPSPEELDAITSQPAPGRNEFSQSLDAGDGWQLDGPFPAVLGQTPLRSSNRWESALANMLEDYTSARLTEQMRCVAREMGRFYLERDAMPASGLRRFMLSSCRSTLPYVSSFPVKMEVGAQFSEDQLLEDWRRQSLDARLAAALGRDRSVSGVWFGHKDESALIFVVVGIPRAVVDPIRPILAEGDSSVVIEGRVLEEAEYLSGYVNQGEYGVAECELDLATRLPRFRLTCPLDPEDATMMVQIAMAPPDRVLSQAVIQFQLNRTWGDVPVYQHRRFEENATATSTTKFTNTILFYLNRIRQQVGLRPVAVAELQSRIAERAAPYYFGAAGRSELDKDTSDTIALTMLAGTKVDGVIRDGVFISTFVTPADNAVEWLLESLALPMGRIALLREKAEQIAVGPMMFRDPDVIAAIVTGYVFHRLSYHNDDLRLLVERLSKARERLGLSRPVVLGAIGGVVAEQLRRINQGEAQPSQALGVILEAGTNAVRRPMAGYLIEAINPNAIEIPEKILKMTNLALTIGITHHRPEGAAWAQLVVLIAYISE